MNKTISIFKLLQQTCNQALKKIDRAILEFFLKPASSYPISALRIGISIILIVQAYMLRNSMMDFFAQDGIVQGYLVETLGVPYTPKIAWLVKQFSNFGPLSLSESTCIWIVCSSYIISLSMMLVGIYSRLATGVAWFLHWTLMNSGCTTTYGMDLYAHVFLFYLIWMPSGNTVSLDRLFSGKKASIDSGARVSLRVLQIHLCISYFFSGMEKAHGEQWWNGELLWRALTLPVYYQYNMSWIAYWPFLSKIAGWTTLIMEIGYSIFIWPKLTRKAWIFGIMGLHLGIAVFLGLGLFGSIMCVLTFCVFGISGEPSIQKMGQTWKIPQQINEDKKLVA